MSQPGGWSRLLDKSVQNETIKTLTYHAGHWQKNDAPIISEKPVSLSVNGESWLTFMCTPSDLEELAVGFLYNEEIIQKKHDIASLRVCPEGDNIDVWLNMAVQKPEKWTRTAGCSGGETTAIKGQMLGGELKTQDGFRLTPEKLGDLVHQLGVAQELYKKSGGVHTSALSDGEKILISAEDIGRHNTLDKIAGHCLLEDIYPTTILILTTGRVSSEMIQKSGRMHALVVISRTSPSSLSVQMATDLGISLIGYARQNQFTIYSHPERVISLQASEIIKGEEV
jgi:FdhD protein